MSLDRRITLSDKHGVIAVASNGDSRRTMLHKDGEVLVRIGDHGNAKITSTNVKTRTLPHTKTIQKTDGNKNEAYVYDPRERQHAKNLAYRQSSTKTYVNGNDPRKEPQASHVIYTSHSSATIQQSSVDSSAQSFTTRQITRSQGPPAAYGEGEFRIVTHVENDLPRVTKEETLLNDHAPIKQTPTASPTNTIKHVPVSNGSVIKKIAKDECYLCHKIVYQKEKVGPVRDVLFHKQCFRCTVCNSVLTLSSYCHNHKNMADKRLYCKSHQPSAESSKGDIEDKTIQAGINKPKLERVNTTIRGGPDAAKVRSIDADAMGIKGAMNAPKLDTYNTTVRVNPEERKGESMDYNAINIQTALHAPKMDIYNSTVRVSSEAQRGEPIDNTSVVVQTAMNVPRLNTYNQTVRPVPALSLTAPVQVNDPTAYMSRQLHNVDYTSPPSPPPDQVHVQFDTNTRTYYYSNGKPPGNLKKNNVTYLK